MGLLPARLDVNVLLTRGVLFLIACACGCILSLGFWPDMSAFAQGDVSVTAHVDKKVVSSDDQITLTITVAGQFQQLDEPQLPPLDAFEIVGHSRSSQFSMNNGIVTSATAFSYQLQPTGPEGSYTIEPVVILVNGSPHHAEPIRVEIVEGTTPRHDPIPPNGPTQDETATSDDSAFPAPDGLTGQDLFVEANVDNASPSVGQQIVYRFRVYQATHLLTQPRLEWPLFSGFWAESLKPNNHYEQDAAGQRYHVTEVRKALFPIDAGRVTIEPAKLTIPGDLFAPATELETNTVDIDVQPLPDGAQASFDGAVGQFEMAASAKPEQVGLNEPVTLVVRVTGRGNLTLVPDPTAGLENGMPEWNVYKARVTTNVAQDGDTIVGERVFERLLIPRDAGELTIPTIELAYFDPIAGEYRDTRTTPIKIRISPGGNPSPEVNGKQVNDLLDTDVGQVKIAPTSLVTDATQIIQRPIFWLVLLLPLLVMTVTWVSRHSRQRRPNGAAIAGFQAAGPHARKRLAQARTLAVADEDGAYASVSRAVTDYLGNMFDRPPAGLTHDSIQQALSSRNASAALVERTLLCLAWADTGRFSPAAAGKDAHELIDDAEALIDELETLPKG